MRLLDEQYTRAPYYGVLKMTAYLRQQGYEVNSKRIRRLLRLMGLEAIYQKPRLSQANPDHKVYPYLPNAAALVDFRNVDQEIHFYVIRNDSVMQGK